MPKTKPPKKRAIFTSCNLYYLDRAVVLARSVKENCLGVDFFLMLSDYADIDFFSSESLKCFDYVIDTGEIGIPDFSRWSFQYDVIELCTAVKGYCFKYILGKQYDQVIYLDPDIACFSSIDFLFDLLVDYSILLTPHQLEPASETREIIDNELAAHKYGIYNLGFLGLNSSNEANKFVDWWAKRLRDYCLDDIPNGMFTDQKWCDAVPSYFENFKIVRHPGCNVASWNLCERRLSINNGSALVNRNYQLVFYHFTKYFGAGIGMTKKYSQCIDNAFIWNWYGILIDIARNDMPEILRSDKYNNYTNGDPISKDCRRAYRARLQAGDIEINADPYIGS